MSLGRIYYLQDDFTNQIRYVGQTRLEIEDRLKNHFKDRKQRKNKNNHTANWIDKYFRDHKQKPSIHLIKEWDCNDDELNKEEIYWILEMRKRGYDLTNTSMDPQFRSPRPKRYITGKPVYCYDRHYNEQYFKNSRRAIS